MRILALWSAALGVFVWWYPMDRLSQSISCGMVALLALAFRSARKRLDAQRTPSIPPAGQDTQE